MADCYSCLGPRDEFADSYDSNMLWSPCLKTDASFVPCSAQIDIQGVDMMPCAVKRLPYGTPWERSHAEAEMQAFRTTQDQDHVISCLGVSWDAATLSFQVAMQ